MLVWALLLAVWVPQGTSPARWTYNLKCHDCWTINTFTCPQVRKCEYEVRRCMTVSIRLNPRELLVYKNCTSNCTFLYEAEVPPEAPRALRTNSFYFVRCCSTMTCNEGGPSNMERDIPEDSTLEEELEGAVCLGESATWLLSLASLLAGRALT
uniref:Glycosylphosphatidylinositol anchored molecule like n=1 Tax=Suricata suricatta TaxID=37032 RepID=A0A673UIV0_SURSU